MLQFETDLFAKHDRYSKKEIKSYSSEMKNEQRRNTKPSHVAKSLFSAHETNLKSENESKNRKTTRTNI